MILKSRINQNPKILMMIGMVFMILANIWPRLTSITQKLGEDKTDGIHGLLMGLAIGTLLLFVSINARRKR